MKKRINTISGYFIWLFPVISVMASLIYWNKLDLDMVIVVIGVLIFFATENRGSHKGENNS